MKAVLVFIDGIICDYRQRQHLSGTPDFYQARSDLMKDAPTPDSRALSAGTGAALQVGLSGRAARDGQGSHRRMAERHELIRKGPLFVWA